MSGYLRGIGLADAEALEMLLAHLASSDQYGLDPSLISYDPRLRRLAGIGRGIPVFSKVWPALVLQSVALLGHRVLPVLKPRPLRFAKGLALTLSARAFQRTAAPPEARARIEEAAGSLEGMLEQKRLDCGVWAHDCDYEITGVRVTTQTPNLVTSSFVANSIWDWHRATGSRAHGARFRDLVERMRAVFPAVKHGDGVCFMYTPVTSYHVHNANLLMAELLAKRFAIAHDADDLRLARAAVCYSLADYRDSGGFPYAGPPTPNASVDNYHTGYVLRSLAAIGELLPEVGRQEGFGEVLERGIAFYLRRFLQRGRIWMGKHRMMQTHSLAEAILMHKRFASRMRAAARDELVGAIQSTARELWSADHFVNNVRVLPLGVRLVDRTDMVRWSQAWMAYALAHP